MSNLSYKIITVHNFLKFSLDFLNQSNNKPIRIYRNQKTMEYIYSKMEGLDKIFCITNGVLTNIALSIEIRDILKTLNKNVIVLQTSLFNVNLFNLQKSLQNAIPFDNSDMYKFIAYKSIDIVTGVMIPKITRNEIKKVDASRVLTALFLFFSKKVKKNITFKLKEIISNNDSFPLVKVKNTSFEIFKIISQIQPNLEFQKYLEIIQSFFWGEKGYSIVSYGIEEKYILKIQEILEKNGIEFKNNPVDISQLFRINYDKVSCKGINKTIYKFILIKTFLYFSNINYKTETLIYNDDVKISYKIPILTNNFLSFLKGFGVEEWEINASVNFFIKKRIIKENGGSFASLVEEDLNSIGVYSYNLSYYLKKLKKNNLINVFNNVITLTEFGENYLKILKKDFLFLSQLNSQLIPVIEKIKNEEDLNKFVSLFLKKWSSFTSKLNKPTEKQIKRLNQIEGVPEEAFINKDFRRRFIRLKTKDTLPSEKQLEFAKLISKKINVNIPEETLSSQKLLNTWVFENKRKMKHKYIPKK